MFLVLTLSKTAGVDISCGGFGLHPIKYPTNGIDNKHLIKVFLLILMCKN